MIQKKTYDSWLNRINQNANSIYKFQPESFFGRLIVVKLQSSSNKPTDLIPLYTFGAENGKIAAINLKKISNLDQKALFLASTLDNISKRQATIEIISKKNIKNAIEMFNFKQLRGYTPIENEEFQLFYDFLKNHKDKSWHRKMV